MQKLRFSKTWKSARTTTARTEALSDNLGEDSLAAVRDYDIDD